MTTTQDPIAHAARLLREAAEELRQSHAFPGSEGWENETDAKAAYDEHMAAAQALEDWEAAVGAGGVQALSAAPAIGDELRDTLVAVSAAIAERDDRAAQKMIREILAASPTPPAEQAAPKAAPGEQNAVSAEWLEQAYREGWAACRDAETIGEEAEDWAFGNSTANSRMIDAQQAAPQQEAQEPVAYVEVSQSDAEVSMTWGPEPAGFNLPTGRYALYASPQPAPAPLSESIDQVERALAIIGVVGAIDGHDVVRRESVLEIARRAALAAQGGE